MMFAISKSKTLAAIGLLAITFQLHAEPRQEKTEPGSPPKREIGRKIKSKGIPDFGEVTPRLYRGGQPSPEGLAALSKMGVKIVVDLRGSRQKNEQQEAEKLGMQYVSIPAHCPFPKDEPFAKFIALMRENSGKKVFVHCRLGDDRTGMAVAAYRMSEEHWSADEALKEMQKFGFSASHHLICPSMSSYVHSFPERLKKDKAFSELRENTIKVK
jgi:protein tyrosine phosphatase (PTP) superfamily phosphohydrolase (DUF442 family)